jgi:hypothetical protein
MTPEEAKSSSACPLTSKTARDLEDNKFTHIICPFGIVVAGTTSFDVSLLEYAARVVAELVDGDGDGAADEPAVVDALRYGGGSPAALVCGTTWREEEDGEDIAGIDDSFSCQAHWWVGNYEERRKSAILEEAFHLVHQHGWAEVWPDVFGFADDFSSTVCEEMARLQCVAPGWHHPNNECPGNDDERSPGDPAPTPLDGSCEEPDCDCSEFHRQAALLVSGQMTSAVPAPWLADHMPATKEAAEAMLSAEYLAVLADARYAQPRAPIIGAYTAPGEPAPPADEEDHYTTTPPPTGDACSGLAKKTCKKTDGCGYKKKTCSTCSTLPKKTCKKTAGCKKKTCSSCSGLKKSKCKKADGCKYKKGKNECVAK